MIFFRKKKEANLKPAAEPPRPKKAPMPMGAEERILTAEGWRRHMEKTAQNHRGKA